MVEYYYELKIKPQEQYELFLDLMSELTNEALEEDNGEIISRSESSLEDVEFGIKEFAKQLNIECATSLSKHKNEDWINKYKQSVKSVEIDDFYIYPTWDKPREDKINIIIDPALSFGSGHHETTSNCLRAIGKFVKKGDELLDVGTGSGILGIGAAKLGAIVDICDTDDFAVEDAKLNFEKNEASFCSSWVGSATKSSKKYDVVVANIVADVLIMIAKDLKKCLKDDGILILSGILDKHKDRVLAKYKDMEQLDLNHEKEWVSVVLKNK